jgi:hypothetical protein
VAGLRGCGGADRDEEPPAAGGRFEGRGRLPQSLLMRIDAHYHDEHLLRRLQAPPNLSDGVESLAYWRGRRRRLSWYRWRARREAERMTAVWEQRVGAALLSQPGVSLATRVSAGLLLGRARLQRWGERAALTTMAIGMALIAVPAVAIFLLSHMG